MSRHMRGARALIIGMILNLLFIGPVSARNYPDVPASHKHYIAIAALSDKNIIQGYANGEFHPEGNINRAEAVKILTGSKFDSNTIERALDWHKAKGHKYVMFPDVGISEWFGKYVEVSYQNKVIKGYPDGTFKPANNINFAEALKVILETYKVDLNSVTFEPNTLLYIKKGDWFEPYFTYAYEYNLINQNKFYHPGQLITRGEFVEIMYRLQTVLDTNLPEFIVDKTPTSNEYTITIPKLNIVNLPVYFADPSNEKAALEVLKKGLGHYLASPDSGRKMVLFGHSSGYSWDNSPYKTLLRTINQMKNGDMIYVNYKEKGYAYQIFKSDIILATEDYKLMENQNTNELALYTCWPPNQIIQRYVVYGKPVS